VKMTGIALHIDLGRCNTLWAIHEPMTFLRHLQLQ
jgi:hypothetical protein